MLSTAARRLALAFAALAVGLTAAPAAASVRVNDHLGVIPVGKAQRAAHAAGLAAPKAAQAANDLSYHGGPVMHTNVTRAIYWDGGSGAETFPANYQSLIDKFLTNVAADSGTRGNVYSTDIQYYDLDSHIQYKSTFAGSFVDTSPFPAGLCTPFYPPDPTKFSRCLTDDQLLTEVDGYITAHHLPRGINNLYLIYLPPKVQTCTAIAVDCFGTDYCAYHGTFSNSSSGSPLTNFADLPYAAAIGGCIEDSSKQPQGSGSDPTIDATSHEHNEAITDPLGDAWYSNNQPGGQGENGDLCLNYYGSQPAGQNWNQVIGGSNYFIQGEWSNLDGRCALNLAAWAPIARVSASLTKVKSLRNVAFDGSKSSDPVGSITSYRWNFGDGSTGKGKTVTHRYRTPGKRTAVLTVTDSQGLTASAKVTIKVTNRAPVASIKLPGNPVAGRTAKFSAKGSHDPDGTLVSYRWHFGDHTASAGGRKPSHVYKRAGTYTVRLAVTDDRGRTATATRTLTVGRR